MSVNWPVAERFWVIAVVQVLEPVHTPPTHWKLEPVVGAGVSMTDWPNGTSCDTAQPVMLLVQTSGGVVLAVILPAPLPEAATLSVRALPNFSTTVRFAVMSTRQTEPLRREHPVQPAKLLSTPTCGVRATVVP